MAPDTVTKKDLQPILDQMKAMQASNTRIEMALLGDEGMKIEGMASKVSKHEKYYNKRYHRGGFIAGLSSGIGWGLSHLIKYLTGG